MQSPLSSRPYNLIPGCIFSTFCPMAVGDIYLPVAVSPSGSHSMPWGDSGLTRAWIFFFVRGFLIKAVSKRYPAS